MNVFTLNPKAKPRAVFLLPEKICYQGAANFLLGKLIQPLGLDIKDFAFSSGYLPEKGKLKKADFESEIEQLLEYTTMYGIKIIAVGNADYYKQLTGDTKMLLNIGRVMEGVGLAEGLSIVPILNPIMLNMFPERAKELNRGVSVVKRLLAGDYSDPVSSLALTLNVIYVNPDAVINKLREWKDEPELYVDIETTGLRWYADDLLTMSFARNDKEAFCVAIHPKYHDDKTYAKMVQILRSFFNQYKGKLVGHNWIGFDQAFITHEIMRNKNFDTPQYELINRFNLEDSMLLAHILYNSTEKPSIGLKELVFSEMGEYDADIDQKNLYSADLNKVGLYNNYDVIATCKLWKQLNKELQEEEIDLSPVYQEFKEIGISLLKMKMNGLRVDRDKVGKATEELTNLVKEKQKLFKEHPIIIKAEIALGKQRFKKYNATLKNKKKWEDEKDKFIEPFNASSPQQKQFLFFELMDMPVIKLSKTSGNPSTDQDVIDEWKEMSLTEEQTEILDLISDIQAANKVNGTYLKAFQTSSIEVKPNHWKVFANFNQAGTISGRLSSSGGINFQNLPSNSTYGDLIKKLLIPDDGFIIAAVDYAALEERLIAIESDDKNKLRIFLENIDGHCLNAYAYFKDTRLAEKGIEINPESAESINSIKKLAPDCRQDGKSVTFGINYGAGPKKIAQQLKCSIEEAQAIYDNYWSMYKSTWEFNQRAIQEARDTGYVMSRFSGLRVKMASIHAKDEYVRSKEERRAANFKTQSGNFLTLRGLHQFQLEIEKEGLVDKVKICNTVHDSIKLQIKLEPETIKWTNDVLISLLCTDYKENQSLKLEAELDIGFNEKNMVTMKNRCTISDIKDYINQAEEELYAV